MNFRLSSLAVVVALAAFSSAAVAQNASGTLRLASPIAGFPAINDFGGQRQNEPAPWQIINPRPGTGNWGVRPPELSDCMGSNCPGWRWGPVEPAKPVKPVTPEISDCMGSICSGWRGDTRSIRNSRNLR